MYQAIAEEELRRHTPQKFEKLLNEPAELQKFLLEVLSVDRERYIDAHWKRLERQKVPGTLITCAITALSDLRA